MNIKGFIWEFSVLSTSIIMSIPLAFVRQMYCKIILKQSGKQTRFMRHVRFYSPHKIKIGNNVFLNRECMLDGRKGLEIGDNVDIGEYVSIWSLEHDPDDNEHKARGGLTVIEDHVWIAPRAIILPGIRIGRGAVVGTGSVVTKDIPPLTVVAGVPAKKIRQRNNDLEYKLNNKIFF